MKLKHVNKNAVYNNYLKTLTNKQKKEKIFQWLGFQRMLQKSSLKIQI